MPPRRSTPTRYLSASAPSIGNWPSAVTSPLSHNLWRRHITFFRLALLLIMYLSQPRDLINSMSTGCSRGSIVVLPRDHDSLDSLVPSADIENLTALRPSLTCDQNRLKPHDTAELQTPPLSARAEGNPVSLVYTPPNTLTKALFSCDGISASRWFRAQHFQKIWERLDPGSPSLRPPHPYSELIKLCILKRREGKLTLCELYQDLEAKFFFYAKSSSKGRGWRVSIRMSLLGLSSLLSCPR